MRLVVCFLFLAMGLIGSNPELMKVKSVYLFPMTYAMDQYLANQLQRSGLYIVTTDPKAADAVMTDSLGPTFEKKMDELYTVKPEPKEGEDEDDAIRERDGGASMPESSFRRGRGNVYLVERHTRQVVWSTYERPKNSLPKELDTTARRIAEQLKKEVAGKQ
jgi:hypothetical protein